MMPKHKQHKRVDTKTHSIAKQPKLERIKYIALAFIFLGIALSAGKIYQRQSHADTFLVSAEAESGIIAGSATKLAQQTGASGDSSVKFGSGSSADECVIDPSEKLLDQDTSDSQKPWKRPEGQKMNINFSTQGVPAEWVGYMQYGADQWNRSPCLDVKLVPSCSGVSNCVPTTVGDGGGDDGNFNADEQGDFTVGGDIEVLSTLSQGEKKNVMIHEMGHAVGLVHRKTENVLMNGDTYDDVFDPDETDMHNLLVSYANQ